MTGTRTRFATNGTYVPKWPPDAPAAWTDPLNLASQLAREWAASLAGSHEGGLFLPNDQLYWSPLAKPLSDCVAGVVSSAGIHTHEQEPFDLLDPLGDPTIREIPGDIETTVVPHVTYHSKVSRSVYIRFPQGDAPR